MISSQKFCQGSPELEGSETKTDKNRVNGSAERQEHRFFPSFFASFDLFCISLRGEKNNWPFKGTKRKFAFVLNLHKSRTIHYHE